MLSLYLLSYVHEEKGYSKEAHKKEIAKREAVVSGPLYTDADVLRYIGIVLEQSNENLKQSLSKYMSLNVKPKEKSRK